MNKIYKIIWSKTKNMYVVVSEIVKRTGKSKNGMIKRSMIACMILSSLAGSVYAVDGQDKNKYIAIDDTVSGSTVKSDASASGNCALAVGVSAIANGNNTTALGAFARALMYNSVAIGNSTVNRHDGIAIGENAIVGANPKETGQGDYGIAIGSGSQVWRDHGMAIGEGAWSMEHKLSFYSYR